MYLRCEWSDSIDAGGETDYNDEKWVRVNPAWRTTVQWGESRMYRHWKRGMDVVLSGLALLVLSPVLLLAALAVKLDSPGPVLFRQKRLGRYGTEFTMYKFRSMTVGAEHTGSGVYSEQGDPRVTRVGRVIRAASIDELPQLWNILRGDMSIVGPRPPLTYHPWPIEAYTEEQRHMFDVRLGVTGWAQVNGRKAVEWHRRIEMNVWYTRNLSLWLDLKILLMTVRRACSNADNVNDGATVRR